jgi:hypothetical protein
VRPLAASVVSLVLSAGCQLATDFTLTPVAETSEALCADDTDNDFNGLTDCQDWTCLGLLPCCDIPEILLEDDFEDGPACSDPACVDATCAALSCGPDPERWHAWPCPYPTVCDGALRIAKTECFAAGVLSHASMSLDPGLVVEVEMVGVPELRGYLEVALTLQDETDLPGHFAECGRQQRVSSFASVRQVAAEGGWQAVAFFQEQEIGRSAVISRDETVAIGIDASRMITYSVGGSAFATGSIPVPATDYVARLALTGLTEQAAFGRVRIQAGLRCHSPRAFTPVGGTIEASTVLSGQIDETLAFDRDEVYHPAVRLIDGDHVEMFYTGCRWPPDRESCDNLNVGIGRALDGVRDADNPLLELDDIPMGGESGIRTDMQVDLFGSEAVSGYFSPTSGTPIFHFEGQLGSLESSLPSGVAGTWDYSEICCGTAAQHPDGRIFLWYAGRENRDEGVWRVGLATSNDGITFTRHPQNPVLQEGDPGAFDSGGVSQPVVVWDENRRMFRMWYEARDFFAARSIGYAVSPDGVRWSRSPDNPVLTADEVGLRTVGGPDVILLPDGRLRMWIHGTSTSDLARRIYELSNEGALREE